MTERLLIVEDEETLRRNLTRFLQRDGRDVDAFGSAEEALEVAGDREYAVALLDVRLPGKDGITLAAELTARWPDTAILLMTAYASVESVVDAMRAGAQDYLLKPVLMKEVARKVTIALDHRRLRSENTRLRQRLHAIEKPVVIAKSKEMRDLLAYVRQIAASTKPVLFQGESGSGKEVLARTLHEASPRAMGPFVAVSMTAIAEDMIESCLFGAEPGVFGSDTRRDGLFRAASGGTLFLDDVGDIPMAYQAKLLRVIEAHEVIPVGSDRPVQTDVRIVAATNLDLAALVREKRFRGDLYFRLGALRVDVPPLRAHPEDIPPLASHFLVVHAREQTRGVLGCDAAAEQRLMAYSWPGNVRELWNVMERAALVCSGHEVTVADLPPEIAGARTDEPGGYNQAMESFERALLRSTRERCNGDRREAAQALGMSLATLYRRVEKLGLKETPGAASHDVHDPDTKGNPA
ncbi:MAG: sigma-54 dependent transcriptional regulator [Polyangiaceae bacterium]